MKRERQRGSEREGERTSLGGRERMTDRHRKTDRRLTAKQTDRNTDQYILVQEAGREESETYRCTVC